MNTITPHYRRAKALDTEDWQGVTLELLGSVETAGVMRYRFLLSVRGPALESDLWVSSERSRLLRTGASHGFFLGLFVGGRHLNLGQSKDWSDKRLFLLKAMTLVREELARPVVLWPAIRMEKSALSEVWAESGGAGAGNPARDYLKHYDAGLPPMLSRRTGVV